MPLVKNVQMVAGVVTWYGYTALASRVLAVFSVWAPPEEQTEPAVKEDMENGKFKRQLRVYVGAVPGRSHPDEWGEVCRCGDKVSPEVAKAIFPRFADCEYIR